MKSTKPQLVWILKHTFCDGTDVISIFASYEALMIRLSRILEHADEDDAYEILPKIPQTEAVEQKFLDDHLKWKAERNK
jgi:hypothetical protein